MQPVYSTKSTRDVASFLDSIANKFAAGDKGEVVLDSVKEAVKNESGVTVPPMLDDLLGRMSDAHAGKMLDGIQEGIKIFHKEHGTLPTADVVEAAIQHGAVEFRGVDARGNVNVLDAATSAHHDQGALQANRAVVATLSTIGEAIPFAAYLPFDIGSNKALLAILSHMAGNNYGDYAEGAIMDGTNTGDVYASSSRMVMFDVSGSQPFNRKFSKTNLTTVAGKGYCDPAADGLPVLRGRTIVYVNGIPAGTDSPNGVAANSPINFVKRVGGTDYTFAGFVTVASGEIQLTTVSPSLPVNNSIVVTAQSFVDYEKAPSLIPNVLTRVDMYEMQANPWRVKTGITIDASGQIKNELGLDANAEALMAIRTQMGLERHFQALRMAWLLSINNQDVYDFDYDNQISDKNRAQIWADFMPILSNVDQKMANLTMDHGITHIYAPAWVIAQWEGLSAEHWTPSGINKRAGIYRAGRLFGKYDVYYTPKVVFESNDMTEADILCIGRSSQVGRCPIVLGDAIAPTFLEIARQADLVDAAAMYARDFTSVNPHEISAQGCARIKLTNLK